MKSKGFYIKMQKRLNCTNMHQIAPYEPQWIYILFRNIILRNAKTYDKKKATQNEWPKSREETVFCLWSTD
jgi:hypothetical protein